MPEIDLHMVIALLFRSPKGHVGCRVVPYGTIYPAIYYQVFGPAPKQACENFVKKSCSGDWPDTAGPQRGTPKSVRSLIGHKCRVYKTGDVLTMDFWPDRVNIEVNASGIIVDIWFG